MRKLSLLCFIVLLTNTLYAQTLFTYGGKSVDKKEFLRVYKKNAINQKPDFSREALREYLDLYALFRMKVEEAEEQKVDTTLSIQYELGNYRKQLASKYLTDEEVNRKQLQEAYDRMQEVVRVKHIMIYSSAMSPSKDTIEPYRRIDSVYKAVVSGKAKFEDMAQKYSDDKVSAEKGGDVGYVTTFNTLYEFENAVYATPVGKISKPFRTQYGYHIVKIVDRKKAEGKIEVAQVMFMTPKSKGPEVTNAAKENAKKVYTMLKKGADFDEIVKEYSEDKFSKDQNGVLPAFSRGEYTPEFEKAAFALNKIGDISEPVKTEYGYHIIKLIKRVPILPLDSIKKDLKFKIERDDRSRIAREMFFINIKKKNNFKEYPDNINKFKEEFITSIPEEGAGANSFTAQDYSGKEYVLFELKGVEYTSSDFLTNAEAVTKGKILGPRRAVSNNLFDSYMKMVVMDVEEQNIINEKPEIKYLMEEYRDGIMLFELMDRNVWGKASKDSAGLVAFHKDNKSKYSWKSGFRGAVYNFRDMATAKEAKAIMFKKGMTDEKLVKILNTEKKPNAINIERGYYQYEKFKKFPKSAIKVNQLTEIKKNEDGTYTAATAKEIHENGTLKTLNEARGYVIADYQDHLEKTWNKELHDKYPVKVNEKVFDSMVK